MNQHRQPAIAAGTFEWLFQHTLDPLLLSRPDGSILRANEAATRVLGMTEAEICARGRDAVAVNDDALRAILEERARTGAARGEVRARRGDGAEILTEVTTALLPDSPEPLAYVMFRDLTERERAARAPRASEQKYSAIYDNAHVGIALSKWPEDEIVSVNPTFLKVFDFDLDQVLGKKFVDVGIFDATMQAQRANVFPGYELVRNVEIVHQTRSGDRRTLSLSVVPVSIDGKPCILTIAVDITARVAAEQALRFSDARLALLVQHAPTAIAFFDREMRYLAHSRRFLSDFGLPDTSLVGRCHYDVFPDLPEHLKEVHRRCLAGATERSSEERFPMLDGSIEWFRWEMLPWCNADGEIGGVVMVSERITELKHAYERIANQERFLAEIIDGSPSLVFAFDREGRVTIANEAAARFWGFKKDALIGASWASELLPQALRENLGAHHIEVLTTGLSHVDEVVVSAAGSERSIIVARYPLRDASGAICGTASISTDITGQKQTEVELRSSQEKTREALGALGKAMEASRRTEEKLRHSQKMEAIGRLAGGIAHDFNNLLTVILGNSSDVLASLNPGDPLHEIITEIEKAGQRAAGLTRQLLVFGRQQVLEARVVNINELILGAEKMLRRILGEDIEFTLLLDERPQLCKLDKGQFEQVLLNLVVNARDAMPDGGRLTIETTTVTLDPSYIEDPPEAVVGQYVRVTVSDSGMGIPKALQTQIFEPFFTTKDPKSGTGLGLSTVYGIVRQSGGTISVYSEPGQGTTFKIHIPRNMSGSLEIATATPRLKNVRGKETILLVEDDAQVRNTISNILRRAGYHVISADNGGEALLICEQHGGTIHLLLTDVVMPKLNGRKLAERLQQVRPLMRVLFMSGYTENVVVYHGMLDASINFIAKPITSDSLLIKVREVLESQA